MVKPFRRRTARRRPREREKSIKIEALGYATFSVFDHFIAPDGTDGRNGGRG
jgi:hypothetical protein